MRHINIQIFVTLSTTEKLMKELYNAKYKIKPFHWEHKMKRESTV